MDNRLIVITEPVFQGVLSLYVARETRAFLFYPTAESMLYADGKLFDGSEWLSLDETIRLAKVRENNVPLPEPVLLVGIWSYMFHHGLRVRPEVETTEHKLNTFMGLSVGRNGFNLRDKLADLSRIYGIIPGKGVFPFLEFIGGSGNQWVLKSYYLYQLLKTIKEHLSATTTKKYYYSKRAYANLVSAKNKTAAMILLQLICLVTKAGINTYRPSISLHTLAERIPALREILYGNQPSNTRQKRLRRAFQPFLAPKTNEPETVSVDDPNIQQDGVKKTFVERYTHLNSDYADLKIDISESELHVSNPKAVITVHHSGLNQSQRKG
ncbi:hypothetical protein [Paenibacillus cymbidii]|uniref:hypothetical protein n=1 Tax=Paenibacillus cymbidii TaxID=1639034 RepID=UPI0010818314|nr:hypothetical protein [Paenibacillus cymbidii]